MGTNAEFVPNNDDSWIHFISKGNYMHPSHEMIEISKVVVTGYQLFHGKTFNTCKRIFELLTDKIKII